MEEGVNINIPSTIHSIAQFLNSTRETQDPRMYTQLVATLAFTAEKPSLPLEMSGKNGWTCSLTPSKWCTARLWGTQKLC